MKTPEQLAERREKMRLYMAERRKDPIFAAKQRERVKQWQRENPGRVAQATSAWRKANPERVKELNREWRARQTPEGLAEHHRRAYRKTRRNSHLIKTFNITESQYEAMVAVQNGCCATCPQVDLPEKRLAVDHNHKTGSIRALLCDRCNRGIGFFDESAERLRVAADYLDAHSLTPDTLLA